MDGCTRDESPMSLTTTDMANWMNNPDTWVAVAAAIGDHPYTYDMDDSSVRTVVQIVMSAAAKVLRP